MIRICLDLLVTVLLALAFTVVLGLIDSVPVTP